MKKLYFLNTCDTCKKILKPLNLTDFEIREIKTQPITETELEQLYHFTNSYELLFNKRAQKFKSIPQKNLTEVDYKNLILEEYTFLKRPILLDNNNIYIGNNKTTITLLLTKYSN